MAPEPELFGEHALLLGEHALLLGEHAMARVAGVDEAGRGPLAGPVYAAAVILDPARPIVGLDDSKKLSPARREQLAAQIRARALAWAVARAEVEEIDRLNILQATLLAMQRACAGLPHPPQRILVDGNRLPPGLPCPARALVGGDALEPAISAASILAKTARDACCLMLHAQYPQYGFDQHKGYGTALHLARLAQYGPCPAHRRSFAPVRRLLSQTASPDGQGLPDGQAMPDDPGSAP